MDVNLRIVPTFKLAPGPLLPESFGSDFEIEWVNNSTCLRYPYSKYTPEE